MFDLIGPEELLSLSWGGLKQYFLWQPLTYLFIQDGSGQGITITFLVMLFLSMYILWIFGSTLQERLGTARFLGLYLVSGILSGLAAIFVMPLVGHYTVLAGPSSALLAIFMMWTMCNPESELLFFFLLPVKTRWLLAILLGAILLGSLSSGDIVSMTYYLTGPFFGYLYGLLGFGLQSPYAFTHKFDQAVLDIRSRFLEKLTREKPAIVEPKTKIYDFKSGEPVLDDDAFVDAMLTKISQYGEKSLTSAERKRMDQISARKSKR